MTFLLHNADGGLNCEAKLCVSLVQSRSCYYITDKSDTSFICPNTVQDITVSPCSITSQSSLRLSEASSILFVELCSIHAVKASLQNMRALIYVSDLLPQCRSSSAAVSLCWTDFLWCYSKVSILYQKSQSMNQQSSCLRLSAVGWKLSHYSKKSPNMELPQRYQLPQNTPEKCQDGTEPTPPQVESKKRLTLKTMRLMWFYACLCGSWLSQVVCGISF